MDWPEKTSFKRRKPKFLFERVYLYHPFADADGVIVKNLPMRVYLSVI